jgi:dihydropteroate synthase
MLGQADTSSLDWHVRGRKLDLSQEGIIMGILNVTPDSFSDGGLYRGVESALAHARQMIAEGAEILDIGGESTRPGAAEVPVEQEIERTIPVIRALRKEWDGLISIDTSKAEVAAEALAAGADIVNDITGLTGDEAMVDVCRESGCGVVVMHMQGTPRDMQVAPDYEDVVAEIRSFFEERLQHLTAAGLDAKALCFDPGIGFGKTQAHNLELLANLGDLAPHGHPLLLGVSRKSFIGRILDAPSPQDRDAATVAITANARMVGVMIHRVHAVRANLESLRTTEAILHSP